MEKVSQHKQIETLTLTTGGASVLQTSLENDLNLNLGTLDNVLSNPSGSTDATEGSGVAGSFAAKAGDVVTFDYFFDGGDYLPFNDFAFVAVNGEAQKLTSIADNGNYGDTSGIYQYVIQESDIIDGIINFAVGITDVGDTAVTSSLNIAGFKVTPASLVDKQITIIDEPTSKASDTISSFGSVTKVDTTYTLSTAKGAVSQFNLEKALGLDSGILDSTNGNENATEGSAVSAVFAVKSGDILTFDYFFQGGDYLPYDDFAFVSVNGVTSTFSSIGEVGSYGTEAGVFKLVITDENINDDGTIAVSVGVMDVGDTAMDTSLVIKDLALNKEEYINDEVDIDDDLMIVDESKNTINAIGDYSLSDDGDTYFLSTGSNSESQFTLESTLGILVKEHWIKPMERPMPQKVPRFTPS